MTATHQEKYWRKTPYRTISQHRARIDNTKHIDIILFFPEFLNFWITVQRSWLACLCTHFVTERMCITSEEHTKIVSQVHRSCTLGRTIFLISFIYSVEQRSSDEQLFPLDEQTRRIHLDASLCYSHLQCQECRGTKHHLCQLRTQVYITKDRTKFAKLYSFKKSVFSSFSGPQYSNIVMDECQTMDLKEAKVKIDTSAGGTNCDLDYLNSNSGSAGAEETSKCRKCCQARKWFTLTL